MARFSFSGLRVRLIMLVLLAIVPALALILYNAAEERRQAMTEAEDEALQVVRLAASTHDQFVEQAYQILTRLAQLPNVRRGPPAGCRAIFNDLQTQYLQQYPRYTNLGAIGPDGEVYCSVLPVTGPANLAEQPAFQSSLQTLELTLGNYEVDQAIGRATVTLFYPVVDFEGGQALVVVFATLDLDWLSQLAAQAKLPEGSTFSVVDQAGKILIRYPDADRWVGQTLPETAVVDAMLARVAEGTAEAQDADGLRRLYAFTPLGHTPPAPAYVSIGLPADVVFAEANRLLTNNLFALSAVAALALAAAWGGGDLFVLRQVRALVQATQRLSAGDLSARTGLREGRGELNQLAHAFDRMAEALEQREAERRQAETALRKSEEIYRTLAQNFPNGAVILFDRDLRFTLADGAGLAEIGLSKEALEGKTIWDVLPPDVAEILEPKYRAVLTGTASAFEVPFAERIYLLHALPIRNERGEIVAGMAMTQDITGRKQAEQLLERRVEERTRELSALLDVSRSVVSTLELRPLLTLVLGHLKTVIEYTGAGITVLDGEDIVFLDYQGPAPREEIMRVRVPASQSSFPAEVIRRRGPIIIGDYWGDEPLAAASRETRDRAQDLFGYYRSWMGVPLWVKDKIIGVLRVDHVAPNHFAEQHARLALAFADQVAVAIENARLFEAEQRRAEQFRVISEVGQRITSILAVDELLGQTVKLIQEIFGYDHVHIGLVEGEAVVFKAAAGVWGDEPQCCWCETVSLRVGEEGVSGWVAATGEPLLVPDVRREPRYVPAHGDQIRSELMLPIKVKGQVIGVLDIESARVSAFDESDLAVFQSLTNQVAVALENARLYEQAQSLAALQERQKLARELHDSVSQALYGIALGARTARTQLERDASRVAEPLEYVLSLSEAALAEMRALIFELRPESLATEGLIAALAKQAASLRARHRLDVQTQLCDEPELALEAKEALYRIAQEAMHNTVKHARANRVNLQLSQDEGGVTLEVRDNGIGFDASGSFPGHLGLQSMRERVERVGGLLEVESAPDKGTCIRARIPGQAPASAHNPRRTDP